ERANQKAMFQQLIDSGLAKVAGKGDVLPKLNGRVGAALAGEGPAEFAGRGKALYVDPRIRSEIAQALQRESPVYSQTLKAFADVANKAALSGLTEASYHLRNQVMALVS